jgi:hypothetical protein
MKLRTVSFLSFFLSFFNSFFDLFKVRSQSVDCQSTINDGDELTEGNK